VATNNDMPVGSVVYTQDAFFRTKAVMYVNRNNGWPSSPGYDDDDEDSRVDRFIDCLKNVYDKNRTVVIPANINCTPAHGGSHEIYSLVTKSVMSMYPESATMMLRIVPFMEKKDYIKNISKFRSINRKANAGKREFLAD
jgi:hypothetical protein